MGDMNHSYHIVHKIQFNFCGNFMHFVHGYYPVLLEVNNMKK